MEQLLTPALSGTEREVIDERVRKWVELYKREMLEEAAGSLRWRGEDQQPAGWLVDLSEDRRPAVKGCVLQDTHLRREIFGEYQGGIRTRSSEVSLWTPFHYLLSPFEPAKGVEERVSTHYETLVERLHCWPMGAKWRGLAPKVQEAFERTQEFLAAFLDRALLPPAGMEVPPLMSGQLPTGLPAVIWALECMEEYLSSGNDLEDDRPAPIRVRRQSERRGPLPLEDERWRRAAARGDAVRVRGDLRKYAHFVRRLAGPLGVALNLLPAWPLATYLLCALPGWEPGRAALVSGVGLALIGVAELTYWWLIRARRLLNNVQWEAHWVLADRVLSLTARILHDYRLWLLIRLRGVRSLLKELYDVLSERYQRSMQ
ncbi:MAG TPA: hypothetical protein G4O05_03120, partial [Caldilineae bacterium]|nr:hypothetical protein [Caldilineae bacterium]